MRIYKVKNYSLAWYANKKYNKKALACASLYAQFVSSTEHKWTQEAQTESLSATVWIWERNDRHWLTDLCGGVAWARDISCASDGKGRDKVCPRALHVRQRGRGEGGQQQQKINTKRKQTNKQTREWGEILNTMVTADKRETILR